MATKCNTSLQQLVACVQSALSGADSTAAADIVVQSSHKTLSALTQAAMLHVRGLLVNRGRVSQALHLLQVSSVTCTVVLALCDSDGLFTVLPTKSLPVEKRKGRKRGKKKRKEKTRKYKTRLHNSALVQREAGY